MGVRGWNYGPSCLLMKIPIEVRVPTLTAKFQEADPSTSLHSAQDDSGEDSGIRLRRSHIAIQAACSENAENEGLLGQNDLLLAKKRAKNGVCSLLISLTW